jgi:Ribosomal protein S11
MAAEKTKPVKEAAKAAPKKIKARKKDKKNVAFGHAYIKSTFNNTIVSLPIQQVA